MVEEQVEVEPGAEAAELTDGAQEGLKHRRSPVNARVHGLRILCFVADDRAAARDLEGDKAVAFEASARRTFLVNQGKAMVPGQRLDF